LRGRRARHRGGERARSASDRYANLDTASLLRRIEQHPGVVLLATHAPEKIDPAVTKRCAAIRTAIVP
jgi:hypothetical protein